MICEAVGGNKNEFKEIQGYIFSRNFKECVNPVADA